MSQVSSESDRTLTEESSQSSSDSEDERTFAQGMTKEEMRAEMESLKKKLKRQRQKRKKEQLKTANENQELKKRAKKAERSLKKAESKVQKLLNEKAEQDKTVGPVLDFNIDELRKQPIPNFKDLFVAKYYKGLDASDQLEYKSQKERFEKATLDQKITANYLLNKYDSVDEEIGNKHPLCGATQIRIVGLVLSAVLQMKNAIGFGCIVGDTKKPAKIDYTSGDQRTRMSTARVIVGFLLGFNKLHGKDTSHLCANMICLNITHLCLETSFVNNSRKFCHGRGFTGQNGLCEHDVKSFNLVIPDEAEPYELCNVVTCKGHRPSYQPVNTFSEASHVFFHDAIYKLPSNQCTKSKKSKTGKLRCTSKIKIFGNKAIATAHICDLSRVKPEDTSVSLVDSKVVTLEKISTEAKPYMFVSNAANKFKYEPVNKLSEATHYLFKKAKYRITGAKLHRCINKYSVGKSKMRCTSKIKIFGNKATATAHTCDLSKVKPIESKEAKPSSSKREAHNEEFAPPTKKVR